MGGSGAAAARLTQETLHEAEAEAAAAAVWLTQETGVPDSMWVTQETGVPETLYASLSVLVRACWAQAGPPATPLFRRSV